MCAFFQVIIYHSSLLAIARYLQTEAGGRRKPCKPLKIHSSGHRTITKKQKAAPYKKGESTQFCNWLEFTNLSQLLRQNLRLGRVPLARTTPDIPRSWMGWSPSCCFQYGTKQHTQHLAPAAESTADHQVNPMHWQRIKLSLSLCIISIQLLYKYNTSSFTNSHLLLLCLFDSTLKSRA